MINFKVIITDLYRKAMIGSGHRRNGPGGGFANVVIEIKNVNVRNGPEIAAQLSNRMAR